MNKSIEIKRGDTFFVVCTYTDSNNNPLNLLQISIKSQIRDVKNQLISELIVEKLDQEEFTGKFSLKSDTDSWPVGELKWDIQYTSSGNVSSSDTIKINVIPDVTN